jgi:hypothetical protein
VGVLRQTEGNELRAIFLAAKQVFFRGRCVAASSSVKTAPAMILRRIFRKFAIAR